MCTRNVLPARLTHALDGIVTAIRSAISRTGSRTRRVFANYLILRRRRDLHIRVVRAAAAFRAGPVNVAIGVFDVASFAVDAVLRIDLEAFRAVRIFHPFIDACRAIAWRGAIKLF